MNPIMIDADKIIELLNLKPHPKEGGYFAEIYRSKEKIEAGFLPGRYRSDKNLATSIYYLLTAETRSELHRLKSDEIFHFYLGDPVEMINLYPDGESKSITLGSDIANGQKVQHLVPKDVWQGAILASGGEFALLGTTMAPGFDYDDYESADGKKLIIQFPEHKLMIEKLTG